MSKRVLPVAAIVAALAVSSVSGISQVVAQEAAPQQENATEDMDALVERVGEVARKVSAKNEEVKELEIKLEEKQAEVSDSENAAAEAQSRADEAKGDVTAQQSRVDDLAQSRYRGDSRSAVSGALAAENPADAVERMGYLGALSRQAQRTLDAKASAASTAEGEKHKAADAATKVREEKKALEEQREKLLKEKEELEKQQEDIEKQVDALDEQQRQAWEGQFGGTDKPDMDLGEVADGAASAALSKLGAPYGWGAAGPDQFDCSGLMLWAYQQIGKSIPRTSQAQIAGGTSVPLEDLQPGDIVGYYPGVTHVGMYIGNGQVVHASTYGVPVQVVPLKSMPITGTARY